MKKEKASIYLANTILAILLILIGLLFLPQLFGIHAYVVESGSMEPTLKVGTIAYVLPTVIEELEEGDIVSFEEASHIITHRVVTIDKESQTLKTKGDAGAFADFFLVRGDMLVGKMILSINYLGLPVLLAQSGYGKLLFLSLFTLLMIIHLQRREGATAH